MTERMLSNRLRKLQELEAMQKELEKQIEEVKAEIRADMESKGLQEQRCGEYVLRFATIVSNRFDSKSFRADHERLYKSYLKPSEYRRFTITA